MGFVLLVAVAVVAVWRPWEQEPVDPVPIDASSQTVIQPVDLPGLGFLPGSTEAILTIQMPHLLEKLGAGTTEEPATALGRLGIPERLIETIESASGVGLNNVDQLVVGLSFEKGAFPPQLVVVVHTRHTFQMEDIARESKARKLKKDGRTIYAARATPLPEIFWWNPGDRVLVATLLARDFDVLPLVPRTGVGHLRTDLAGLIRKRLPADSCAWLAAASDNWDAHLRPYTLLPLTPLQGRTDLLAPAARLRSMTLAIPLGADRPVDVEVGLKSLDAAEELRSALARRFDGEPVEVSAEGELCRIRTPFDVARLGALIGRLVPSKN